MNYIHIQIDYKQSVVVGLPHLPPLVQVSFSRLGKQQMEYIADVAVAVCDGEDDVATAAAAAVTGRVVADILCHLHLLF